MLLQECLKMAHNRCKVEILPIIWAVLSELIDFFPYQCKPFDSLEIRKGMKITPIFCCLSNGDESHELIKTSALWECILFH